MKAYCVKCRKKRLMKGAKTLSKNGRKMVKGQCSFCKTKMSKFIKKL